MKYARVPFSYDPPEIDLYWCETSVRENKNGGVCVKTAQLAKFMKSGDVCSRISRIVSNYTFPVYTPKKLIATEQHSSAATHRTNDELTYNR